MDKTAVKLILSELTLCNEGRLLQNNQEDERRLRPREKKKILFEVVFHSKIMERVSSDIPFTHSLMCSFIYGSG